MSSSTDLATLGEQVANLAAELQQCQDGHTEDTNPDLIKCEEALQDAMDELQAKIVPPSRWWQSMIMKPADWAVIHVAFQTKLFEHIPLDATIHLRDLAARTKVPEDALARVLRLLVLNRIFAEPAPNHFRHSAISAAAAASTASKGSGFLFHMFSKAGASLADAVASPPEAKYTAWEAAFGAPVYDFFERHPVEREQFGAALGALAAPEMEDLATMFPWAKLAKLVDIGGGSGHVAVHLARRNPHLRLVNQDLPGVIEDCRRAAERVTGAEREVFDRVEFEAHDYNEAQRHHDADAYLLRQCLHNNTDADCVRILKAIVPGLGGPNARLLINESVLEDEIVGSRQKAKRLRQKDIMAMTIAATERTRAEFLALLKAADGRYEIDKIYSGNGDLAIISVKLV